MELPYIAGLFDGEGSVTITKPSPRSDRHRVVVQIAMTHEPTIRAVEASYGGRVQVVNSVRRHNPNASTRYDWRITGEPAILFLKQLKPYLITKENAVAIAELFPFSGRGVAVTSKMRTRREELRVALGKENKRGYNAC